MCLKYRIYILLLRLFDFLNSRVGQRGDKAPLDPSKREEYHTFFTNTKKYLLSLSVMEANERILLVHSKRATGIRGLVTTITSVENIMINYVENPNEDLKLVYDTKYERSDFIITYFYKYMNI